MIEIDVGSKIICNDSKCALTLNKEYLVLGIDKRFQSVAVSDDNAEVAWFDIAQFKLPEQNTTSTIKEKNFSVSVVGEIFCVEAIGLSEEKINKIIDILAK